MQQVGHDFIQWAVENLPLQEPIVEFGSRQVSGEFGDLRKHFPNKKYIGCDIVDGEGVDLILAMEDCCEWSYRTIIKIPKTIISLDALEHMENPIEAIDEAYDLLDYYEEDGILLISSVMKFQYHNPPDYWRFTPEGFKLLLKDFSYNIVTNVGPPDFPMNVFGIGFITCPEQSLIDKYEKSLLDWRNKQQDIYRKKFGDR